MKDAALSGQRTVSVVEEWLGLSELTKSDKSRSGAKAHRSCTCTNRAVPTQKPLPRYRLQFLRTAIKVVVVAPPRHAPGMRPDRNE